MEVDRVVAELGYWPNRATFVREAIMQKLDKNWINIKKRFIKRGKMSMAIGKCERMRSYTTVNLPRNLVREVGRVVEEFGYWPAKTHFMHEAIIEKLEWAKREIEARKHVGKEEKSSIA